MLQALRSRCGLFLFAPLAVLTSGLVRSGTWTPLAHQPTFLNRPSECASYPNANCAPPGNFSSGGVFTANLLTDGSVLVEALAFDDAWNFSFLEYKLSPDAYGNYAQGTWKQVASLPDAASSANPNGWGPYAFAAAVLPDGRVIYEGGEYTGFFQFLLSNRGAIYDPVADQWTAVPAPPFFTDLYPPRALFAPNPIGDSASVVLADGRFMLADKMSRQAALLDLRTLTWTETGTGTKADLNDEEGWTLLPNGKVLTVDCYTDAYFKLGPYPKDPTGSELYDPETGQWSSAGTTLNTLTDPVLSETGPAVLRPDGTVFAVGSSGNTAIYDYRRSKWSPGPHLPLSPQGFQYTAQDAPGALLPNGHVLFAVSGGAEPPGGGFSAPPVAFFEFDGKRLIAEPTIPDAALDASGSVSLLLLPTGQVLEMDGDTDMEIYTPDRRERESESEHHEDWAPEIEWAPRAVQPGGSYELRGRRLNGMSQASMYGDENQTATNYPLVRITNLRTHHVFYSRTHDHSSMAVASDEVASTHFDVPAAQESGPSLLELVANGIASEPLEIVVGSDRDDELKRALRNPGEHSERAVRIGAALHRSTAWRSERSRQPGRLADAVDWHYRTPQFRRKSNVHHSTLGQPGPQSHARPDSPGDPGPGSDER